MMFLNCEWPANSSSEIKSLPPDEIRNAARYMTGRRENKAAALR
jgi:hypothetical protein